MLRRIVRSLSKRWSIWRYTRAQTDVHAHWQQALPGEVEFWRTFIGEPGGRWKDEFARRVDPNEPLEAWVREHLDATPTAVVEILDVGAGPLTSLGKTWPGRQVSITAVDPLAVEYNELLRIQEVTPPVPVIRGEAEHLVAQFGHERFDLVHCANALDHCHDPLRAIQQCTSVVKTGSYVLLRHLRREAENRAYTGLHQWNFDVRDGRLVVSDAWKETDLTQVLAGLADVDAHYEEDRDHPGRVWVVAALRKLAPSHS